MTKQKEKFLQAISKVKYSKEDYESGRYEENLYKALRTQLKNDDLEVEYIIVDSNNNWLSTDSIQEDAEDAFEDFKKISGKDYEGMEVGENLYLYEAVEIKRFEK